MKESCEQILDHPPVYVTTDNIPHRHLAECYENATLHTLRPMLILTYEEYQILKGTALLNQKLKELS